MLVLYPECRDQHLSEYMGCVNCVFLCNYNTLYTPRLAVAKLPAITRDTILQLAKGRGLRVEETPIDINELFEGAANGRYREAFACGTAAVISPIGSLKRAEGEAVFGDGKTPGEVTLMLKKTLTDIQTGRSNDEHGWVHRIV